MDRVLIERLEAASVGSSDLDRLMGEAVGLQLTDGFWRYAAKVTTSLDAALALAERVLPGWHWQLSPTYAEIAPRPWPYYENACDNGGQSWPASTPALALCIAILKATTPASHSLGGDEGACAVVHQKGSE